jgi:hypothetical protein
MNVAPRVLQNRSSPLVGGRRNHAAKLPDEGVHRARVEKLDKLSPRLRRAAQSVA